MGYEINSINELLSIDEIKRVSQSLAMLDLILVQEWEYRYFSFNSTWDSDEMMASMRNGEGDEYFILFSKNGIAGKIFQKNIEAAQSNDVLQMIPDEFSSFKTEPAFKLDYITCCFWKKYSDNKWCVSPALEKIPLLKFRLMLRFKVLFDQKFDKRMEQGLSPFADVMNELEKTEIERELLL